MLHNMDLDRCHERHQKKVLRRHQSVEYVLTWYTELNKHCFQSVLCYGV